jgi:hypothetical protein
VQQRWRWTALLLGLLGCATDDPSAYDRGRLAVCESACEGYQRCSLADSRCLASCANDYHPHGIRPSALLHVAKCLKGSSCVDLESDTAFQQCTERAARAEPLREAVIEYCQSAAKSYFECGSFWPVEECSQSAGVWEDEVLADAGQCHERECDALFDCEHEAFP